MSQLLPPSLVIVSSIVIRDECSAYRAHRRFRPRELENGVDDFGVSPWNVDGYFGGPAVFGLNAGDNWLGRGDGWSGGFGVVGRFPGPHSKYEVSTNGPNCITSSGTHANGATWNEGRFVYECRGNVGGNGVAVAKATGCLDSRSQTRLPNEMWLEEAEGVIMKCCPDTMPGSLVICDNTEQALAMGYAMSDFKDGNPETANERKTGRLRKKLPGSSFLNKPPSGSNSMLPQWPPRAQAPQLASQPFKNTIPRGRRIFANQPPPRQLY